MKKLFALALFTGLSLNAMDDAQLQQPQEAPKSLTQLLPKDILSYIAQFLPGNNKFLNEISRHIELSPDSYDNTVRAYANTLDYFIMPEFINDIIKKDFNTSSESTLSSSVFKEKFREAFTRYTKNERNYKLIKNVRVNIDLLTILISLPLKVKLAAFGGNFSEINKSLEDYVNNTFFREVPDYLTSCAKDDYITASALLKYEDDAFLWFLNSHATIYKRLIFTCLKLYRFYLLEQHNTLHVEHPYKQKLIEFNVPTKKLFLLSLAIGIPHWYYSNSCIGLLTGLISSALIVPIQTISFHRLLRKDPQHEKQFSNWVYTQCEIERLEQKLIALNKACIHLNTTIRQRKNHCL